MSNSNEIQRFIFPGTTKEIRAVLIEGEPWFVGQDACALLELSKPRDALARLDDDQRASSLVDTPGGLQPMAVINEDGLNDLILDSRKPEARKIRRWITGEVLPSIRRTGSYTDPNQAPQQAPAVMPTRLEALRGWVAELERAQALELVTAEQAETIAIMAPDAARAQQTMDATGLALVGTIAKRFGLREKGLREWCYAEKVLIRYGSKHNEPMARYVQQGLFKVKETVTGKPPVLRSVTYVTPKGESWLWRKLVKAGVRAGAQPAQQLELLDPSVLA